MNETKFTYDKKTSKCLNSFDELAFDLMYDNLEKVTIPVKSEDKKRIIAKLGEDAYDGVSTEVQGTRYEERVEFEEIWRQILKDVWTDGVLFRPFGVDEKGNLKK